MLSDLIAFFLSIICHSKFFSNTFVFFGRSAGLAAEVKIFCFIAHINITFRFPNGTNRLGMPESTNSNSVWPSHWLSQKEFLNGSYVKQRWSRGLKARGQDQKHKKNPKPRPRTALPRTTLSRPRTGMLEAKDTRRKCSPKKRKKNKRSLKNLFRRSKIFFRRFPIEEHKKVLCKFSARFLAFSNKISTV